MTRLVLPLVVLAAVVSCQAQDATVAQPPAPRASDSAGPTRTGAVEAGAATSCVEAYSPTRVSARAFAFDGTVTAIGAGTTNRPGDGALDTVSVTFDVAEWWRGGSGSRVAVDMSPPVESRGDDAAVPAYGVGTRLLVSGEARWGGEPLDDPIAWSCGFTRYYDEQTAAAWRAATA